MFRCFGGEKGAVASRGFFHLLPPFGGKVGRPGLTVPTGVRGGAVGVGGRVRRALAWASQPLPARDAPETDWGGDAPATRPAGRSFALPVLHGFKLLIWNIELSTTSSSERRPDRGSLPLCAWTGSVLLLPPFGGPVGRPRPTIPTDFQMTNDH